MMYNRYIPQSDGTYQKSRMPDRQQDPPPRQGRPSRQSQKECREPENRESSKKNTQSRPQSSYCPAPRRQEGNTPGVGSFLRQLLPQNFDTEDLLVVILLLLMCGDGGDGQNTALLTLVIYLFL